MIGPLEPNPATARFLDRVIRIGGPRIGLVDVVFRRDQDREPVTDLTLGAAGGFTVLNGMSADPPNQAAGDLAFKQVALATAEAAMALVTARRVTGRAGRIVVSAQEAVLVTTFQTSNGNLFHWHGTVPDRHGQIAGGSTVLSGDGQWTSFTIHPPNYPRFVEWAERDIGPTVLSTAGVGRPGLRVRAPPRADGHRRRAGCLGHAGRADRRGPVAWPARHAGQRGHRRRQGRPPGGP